MKKKISTDTSEYPDRIPYKQWMNSEFSIARLYGGLRINGVRYVLDYKNAEVVEKDGEKLYKPDLVNEDVLKNEEV